MPLGHRGARRRGMVAGAMISSSRAKKRQVTTSAQQPVAPQQPQATQDTVKLLKELADLKDAGILTEEEFTAKKKQVLGI